MFALKELWNLRWDLDSTFEGLLSSGKKDKAVFALPKGVSCPMKTPDLLLFLSESGSPEAQGFKPGKRNTNPLKQSCWRSLIAIDWAVLLYSFSSHSHEPHLPVIVTPISKHLQGSLNMIFWNGHPIHREHQATCEAFKIWSKTHTGALETSEIQLFFKLINWCSKKDTF